MGTDARITPPPGTIRVLDPLVVNQIAAGEVVERPASVVKELVDNAIDAGTTRIVIELERGGVELVRVTDNGRGIAQDELPLAAHPHATSKIASTVDLDAIATMGFRGEAIASIASVARLEIRSRAAGSQHAASLSVNGGSLGDTRPSSGPVGTRVSVRNLFFNTPARRKFLKTEQTERGHCADMVKNLAIAHPSIAFELTADGRTLLDVPAGQSPRDRALAVLGQEFADQLIDAHADRLDDDRGLALWGLIGTPDLARPTAKRQHVFLNGRPIRDKTVQHALREAYRGLIEPGRYPMAVLMLEMSPAGVDVNVHPSKAEVRFRDQRMVHRTVHAAVRAALDTRDLTPTTGPGGGWSFELAPGSRGGGGFVDARLPYSVGVEPSTPTSDPSVWRGAAGPERRAIANAAGFAPRGPVAPDDAGQGLSEDTDPEPPSEPWADAIPLTLPEATRERIRADLERLRAGFLAERERLAAEREAVEAEKQRLDSLRRELEAAGLSGEHLRPSRVRDAAGQGALPAAAPGGDMLRVHNSFLITQDERGLVIIDQHALHERVMFEQLKRRVTEAGGLESQQLLMPAVFEVGEARAALAEELRPLLTRLGIDAGLAGPGAVSVHAFATFLSERGVGVEPFMLELLERAESDGFVPTAEEALHEVLDMMACKAAVKAGDRLTPGEVEELLKLRDETDRSAACPHGRPTSIRLTLDELERQFGR